MKASLLSESHRYKCMNNPFSLAFGTKPPELVERPLQTDEILSAFTSDPINQRTFMITGVRGSGKTVLLTELSARLKELDNWMVIPLSPEADMIHSLAAKLSNSRKYYELFRDAKINLSLLGFGLEMDGVPPVTDDETAIERMLESLGKKGHRVLLTVDEVTNNKYIRQFASVYQIMIREELPVFLLMTGLYENIYDLQNEKSLTFLYRAPKIQLQPLNMPAIATAYRTILQVDKNIAVNMAKLTRGYAFAFQVLGYFTFREPNHDYHRILPQYRLYLDEYVYDKLWSEMSEKDRDIVKCMAEHNTSLVSEIKELTGFSGNDFSQYRQRLIRKGIVEGKTRGILSFVLPLFDEYVRDQILFS